jgi:hypothetical protein
MTAEQEIASLKLELRQARKATDQTIIKLEYERRTVAELKQKLAEIQFRLKGLEK